VSTRSARALRGSAFAVLATVIAATAHTLAGGGAPSPLFCAVIAALAVPGATALAGSRPALWRTVLAVGGSQVLFHAAFAVTGDLGRWDATAGHHHHAGIATAPEVSIALGSSTTAMTLAHVAAAAVTILAVHRGERVIRAILQWLPRSIRRFLVVAPPARHRVPHIPSSRVAGHPVRLRSGAVSRRGPPRVPALVLPA
jgi:hypothetical protein